VKPLDGRKFLQLVKAQLLEDYSSRLLVLGQGAICGRGGMVWPLVLDHTGMLPNPSSDNRFPGV